MKATLPDKVVACVGGGSNAIGMFQAFLNEDVELIGAEAAGKGIDTPLHAATISKGTVGVIHGSLTYLIQDEFGQIIEPYSISAGLDYPGIGPEHAILASKSGRVTYDIITDEEAVDALKLLSETEGILPAIESAHALAKAFKLAKGMDRGQLILVCLSGTGRQGCQYINECIGRRGESPCLNWIFNHQKNCLSRLLRRAIQFLRFRLNWRSHSKKQAPQHWSLVLHTLTRLQTVR